MTSHVAASRVGGGVSQSALQAKGIDAALVPTVLLGRHPGWGAPGGGAVDDAVFSGMLDGIRANGLFALTDAVLTGYFASAGQVAAAADAIDTIRSVTSRKAHGVCAYAPEPVIVVDPIMGDDGKAYVPETVSAAIREMLLPRADLVTPNAFELGWLSGMAVTDPSSALTAARTLGRPVLASSIPVGGQIGILYADAHCAWLVTHDHFETVPHGTGDLLTAAFLAARLGGADPKAALEQAAATVWDAVLKARAWSAFELPDVTARLNPLERVAAGLEARTLEDSSPQSALAVQSDWVLGVDGCGRDHGQDRWVGCLLDISGVHEPRIVPLRRFADSLTLPERPRVIAVDIPIGLTFDAIPIRECERAASALLKSRRSSVFPCPSRAAVEAFTEALKTHRWADAKPFAHRSNFEAIGRKLNPLALCLLTKIHEVDRVLAKAPRAQIYEVHPELCFATMKDSQPCTYKKTDEAGLDERRRLLRANGFPKSVVMQERVEGLKTKPDDILDACAAAWTAKRIALGLAERIGSPDQTDERNLPMSMWR